LKRGQKRAKPSFKSVTNVQGKSDKTVFHASLEEEEDAQGFFWG